MKFNYLFIFLISFSAYLIFSSQEANATTVSADTPRSSLDRAMQNFETYCSRTRLVSFRRDRPTCQRRAKSARTGLKMRPIKDY